MISLDLSASGGTAKPISPPWLFEDSGIHKYNGKYYYSYCTNFSSGHPADIPTGAIAYMVSDNPMGPFTYVKTILPNPATFFGVGGNNHHGIFEFKGEWYITYHAQTLAKAMAESGMVPEMGGQPHGYRNAHINKLSYDENGVIQNITADYAGVAQVKNVDPYNRVEAENIGWSGGVSTEKITEPGSMVSSINLAVKSINNADWTAVSQVDFGDTGASVFKANVASGSNGGAIELRLDSADGALIGTLPISNTGGDDSWQTETTSISGATGVHDLYMVYRGGATEELFKVDYWQFEKKSADHELVAINASIDKHKIDIVPGTNEVNLLVTAIYADGTSADVTAEAAVTPSKSNIVSVSKGIVTGIGYGSTSIEVSYGGQKDTLHMLVKDLNSELTVKNIIIDNSSFALEPGGTAAFKVTAEYIDGHTEDVTKRATYTNPNPEIAVVLNGEISAKASGSTQVIVSFKGTLGDVVTSRITVTVNTPTVIAIEAETAAENTSTAYASGTINDHTWTLADGLSTKAMYFGPNTGFAMTGTDAATLNSGAKLGYSIDFPTTGTYNVWLLIKTTGYDSDSIHVGLDNQYKFTINGIEGVTLGQQFKWVNISGTAGGMFGGATLNVTAGVHELNFWGREDGLTIDRILLTTSNATTDPIWPSSSVSVTGVTLDKTTLSLAAGSSETLTATITPSGATNKTVTFVSSDIGVATVTDAVYDSSTGKTSIKVNAIAAGNAVITATTVDGNRTAVSNVTVTPLVEPLLPAAKLSADSSVKPGKSFTVAVSLDNLEQNVYAEDITLTYDSNVFEYVSAAGANENIRIVTEDNATAGLVRLITANIGGITGESTLVLNVNFKVKAGVQNTSGAIAISEALLGVAPEGNVVEAALDSINIAVGMNEVVVDKTALISAITNADALYDGAVVGTLPGQYSKADKDLLEAAINEAKAVRDKRGVTQSEVDRAVTALNSAVDTFKKAVIKEVSADINNDASINVGDLAMVAYYYGKDSTDPEWATIKKADMNRDNKIDIVDLAYVATKIHQ